MIDSRLSKDEAKQLMKSGWKLLFFGRFVPKKTKIKMMRKFMDGLDEKVFENMVEWIVRSMTDEKMVSKAFDRKDSSKYATTEEEVDYILGELPRLKPYRRYFLNSYANIRERHGLPR